MSLVLVHNAGLHDTKAAENPSELSLGASTWNAVRKTGLNEDEIHDE